MEVKNKVIIKATEAELFEYYLSRGWDAIMDFNDYKRRCKEKGTIITDEKENKRRVKCTNVFTAGVNP